LRDVIDHQKLNRAFRRLQFQTELLLNRDED